MAAQKFYYCADGKTVIGPFGLTEMRKMLVHGIIKSGAKICREGSDVWAFPESFPEFQGHTPEPARFVSVEDYNALTDASAPWRAEPASDAQKRKLKFFGRSFRSGITKGEASEMLDQLDDPKSEAKYQAWKETGYKTGGRFGLFKLFLVVSILSGMAYCVWTKPPEHEELAPVAKSAGEDVDLEKLGRLTIEKHMTARITKAESAGNPDEALRSRQALQQYLNSRIDHLTDDEKALAAKVDAEITARKGK